MGKDRYDPDEKFSLGMKPEEALGALLDGAGAEGEEVEMEPEEPEAET
jgi:hypothetical protein